MPNKTESKENVTASIIVLVKSSLNNPDEITGTTINVEISKTPIEVIPRLIIIAQSVIKIKLIALTLTPSEIANSSSKLINKSCFLIKNRVSKICCNFILKLASVIFLIDLARLELI